MKFLIFLLMAFASQASAQAEPFDGGTFLRACQPTSERGLQRGSESGYCLGFIIGFLAGQELGPLLPKACAPLGVTTDQYVQVAVKWLKEHPERLHEHSAALIGEAYNAAFPCRP